MGALVKESELCNNLRDILEPVNQTLPNDEVLDSLSYDELISTVICLMSTMKQAIESLYMLAKSEGLAK